MTSPEPLMPDLDRLARDVEWLRRLARRLITDSGRAEDFAQETWLAALRGRPRAPRVERRWLVGTLHNLARLRFRQEARREERERRAARSERVAEAVALHQATDEVLSDSTADADLALVGHRRLVDAVLALPEAQRRVLVLRYWRDLPPSEIAAQLGESTASVKGRLRRALAELRTRVVDLDDERTGGAQRASGAPALLAFIAHGGAAPLSPTSVSPLIALLMTKFFVLAAGALVALVLLVRVSLRSTDGQAGALHEGAPSNVVVIDLPSAAEPSAARVPVAPLAEPNPWTVDRVRDLHGVVVTPDGSPQADARIRVHANPWTEPMGTRDERATSEVPALVAETRADSPGRYRVALELGQLYDVIADAPGFGRVSAIRRLAGERVDLQLAEPRTISGRVLLEGAPVPGARVSLGPRSSYTVGPAFVIDVRSTDGQARYTFKDVVPGAYALAVEADGLIAPLPQRIDVGQEDVEHDIVLARGRVVRGRVLEAATQSPIVDCIVRAGAVFSSTRTVVDGHGGFELAGVPTRPIEGFSDGDFLALIAEAPGHVSKLVQLPFLAADAVQEDLLVELERGASIKGRMVVDGGAAPPVGTRVLAVTLQHGESPLARREKQVGRVAGDGQFEVTGLRPQLRPIRAEAHAIIAGRAAQCALFVDAPGFATMVWVLPSLDVAVAPLDVGTLRLPQAGSVSGRVVDRDGAPVPHAMVIVDAPVSWARALAPEQSGLNPLLADLTSVMLDTDDIGRFHRGALPPGEVVITARLMGSAATAELRVDLGEGETTEVELQLDLAGSIAGRVVGDGGEGVPGANIHVARDGAGNVAVAEADADGRFRIAGLGEGPFRLWVWEPTSDRSAVAHRMPATVEGVAAHTEDVIVVLRDALTLRGVVRSSAGAPLPSARLKLDFAGSYPTIELNMDAEGRFERQVPRDERVDIWVAPRRTDSSEPYDYVLVSAGWTPTEELLELTR